jgi:hypothetical protein
MHRRLLPPSTPTSKPMWKLQEKQMTGRDRGKKNQHCFLRHFHSWLAIISDSAHAAEPRSRQCLPPPRIDAAKQRSRTTSSVPPSHRRTKRLHQFLLRIDGTGIAETPNPAEMVGFARDSRYRPEFWLVWDAASSVPVWVAVRVIPAGMIGTRT